MSKPKPKILRVGLVREGKVVKEHLLHTCDSVTIGTGDRCTFQLDIEGLPAVYPLIKYKDKRYSLQFTPKMDGAMMVTTESGEVKTLDFTELATTNLAQPQGELYSVEMNSKMRGKIQVGPFTLLFQFTTPPPKPKHRALPSGYKRFSFKNLDWVFVNIFLMSCFLQGGSFIYLTQREYKVDNVSRLEALERYVKMANIKPKTIKKPDPPKVDTKKKKVDKKGPKVKKDLPKPTTPEKRAARRTAIKKQLMSRTALGALGGGLSSALSTETNALVEGAFEGVGIASSRGAVGGGRGGGMIGSATGEAVGIGNGGFGQSQRPKKPRKLKKRERKIKSALKVRRADEVVGVGNLSEAKIGRVVRRNSKRIQGCYESELKKDRTLRGVIKVRFVILQNGRVGKTQILKNSMNSRTVAKCIQRKIKRWRFRDKPKGGSVTVAYPFHFTPAN